MTFLRIMFQKGHCFLRKYKHIFLLNFQTQELLNLWFITKKVEISQLVWLSD